MKQTFFIVVASILVTLKTHGVYSQEATAKTSAATSIADYFKPYDNEPNYKIVTMNEDLIKRSNQSGLWKNPGFAKFMRSITIYQSLRFDSTPEHSNDILKQVLPVIKKDNVYKEYYKLEKEGTTYSCIFTRTQLKKIVEFAYITINNKGMVISSFSGNDISTDDIHAMISNK